MAELRQRPLPDGVDPTKVETYLSDKEFEVKANKDFALGGWESGRFPTKMTENFKKNLLTLKALV